MFGSIKSQRSGIKLRCDLGVQIASMMVIGSGVFGGCFEGIRVEVRREILSIDLVCPGFFGWALSLSLGLLSDCVDGKGARY